MNIKTFALLGGALLLAGCPGEEEPTEVPEDTSPTVVPTPTPAPFGITFTLTDGDGAADTLNANGQPDFDAGDKYEIAILNTATEDANIVGWEAGIVRTPAAAGDWNGEDCDGMDIGQGEVCHTMGTADGTLTLNRVATIGEVSDGNTLFSVDFPVSGTPSTTYVLHAYDAGDILTACWVYGELSYYAGLGCTSYTPAM